MYVVISRLTIKKNRVCNFETNRNKLWNDFFLSHQKNARKSRMKYRIVEAKRKKEIKGRLKSNCITSHIKYKYTKGLVKKR